MRLTVERLGHLGEGVAPGPVYVARALPGEEVEGAVAQGRIAAPRILTPSPDRVRPPCRHFPRCGSCTLQHASDAFLAGWKVEVVRAALDAQGLDAFFRPVIVSPPGTRRRATLAGRRTKAGALVGFHARGSDEIVEISDCRLLHPDLMAALPLCERLTQLGGSRKGVIGFALTWTEAGLDLAVTGGKAPDIGLCEALAAEAEAADLARLTWTGETMAERRSPIMRFGQARVALPPGAFLQATAEGEAALQAAVAEAVAGAARIADLFAGCGTFALPLAERAGVHAVESDAAMLAALDAGWRRAPGLKRVTTEARDLFRNPLSPHELARFNAVVIDPPRAGATAQTAALAVSGVARIACVSCNPVSFARDARTLAEAGFRLDWVQVVDQFRWSPHVELAAAFSRGHIPG